MEPIWAMSIGAGLKSTIMGVVRQALGGVAGGGFLGISDDILAIGIGYLGYKKLSGTGRDILAGVMIAGVAGIVEGAIGGMPLLGGITGARAQAGALTLEQEAATYA